MRALLAILVLVVLVGCTADGGNSRTGRVAPSKNENSSDVFSKLGSDYMRRGDFETALSHLQKAIKLNPRSSMAQSTMGILLSRIGRGEQAEKYHRRAAELAPEDGSILNNYASYLCAERRYAEADAIFRRALSDPFYQTPGAAATNAGMCALQGNDLSGAEEYFRSALKRSPNNAAVFLPLATTLYRSGDHLRARAFLQRSESANGDSAELLDLAIQIETALKNAAAANEYKQRLLSNFPLSPEALRLSKPQ